MRPISAKTIYYNTDGGGRDTYIQVNNGGLTKGYETITNFELGAFPFKRAYKLPNTFIDSKTLRYRSDGSGRDSYITTYNGGFHLSNTKTTSIYHTFASTLRSIRPASCSRNGSLSIAFSSRANNSFNVMRTYQARHIDRLAQPRTIRNKYNNYY